VPRLKFDNKDLVLYAVTDRSWLNENTLENVVEEGIKAGITFLQLREKTIDQETFIKEAKSMKRITDHYAIPFVINDNVEVAILSDADGVHVGQSDMEVSQVRKKIGKEKILGVSVQTVEQAMVAEKDGADYLGVGAVFKTGTKADASEVSWNTLYEICHHVSIPVVAIGGITQDNMNELEGSGINGIAVVSSVFAQVNIENATKMLKKSMINILKK
jgi:thiamine-phosphate pyrophosphorylase